LLLKADKITSIDSHTTTATTESRGMSSVTEEGNKKRKVEGKQARSSERLDTQKQLLRDKERDGNEERREKGLLQAVTGYVGGVPYSGGVDQKMRTKVNRKKEMSRNGKELCYDKMKDLGSACYLCSLPLNVMCGLLQGLKTENAVKQFNKDCKVL
jgi:hypothetical protein